MSERERWLADRRLALTGTDMTVLMGVNPWVTEEEVWLDKQGLLPERPMNAAMVAGMVLEPLIQDWVEKNIGPLASRGGQFMKLEGKPIGATPDGFLKDGPGLEIKTHGDEWADHDIPERVLIQIQTGSLVAESRNWLLVHYRRSEDEAEDVVLRHAAGLPVGLNVEPRVLEVAADPEKQTQLLTKAEVWWEMHILLGLRPNAKEVGASPSWGPEPASVSQELLERFQAAKDQKGAWEAQEKSLRAEILKVMGDAKLGTAETLQAQRQWIKATEDLDYKAAFEAIEPTLDEETRKRLRYAFTKTKPGYEKLVLSTLKGGKP